MRNEALTKMLGPHTFTALQDAKYFWDYPFDLIDLSTLINHLLSVIISMMESETSLRDDYKISNSREIAITITLLVVHAVKLVDADQL